MDWNQPIRRRSSRAVPLVHGDALETFAQHRVCTRDTCTAHLSRYNPSDVCAEHRGWRDQQRRSRRADP